MATKGPLPSKVPLDFRRTKATFDSAASVSVTENVQLNPEAKSCLQRLVKVFKYLTATNVVCIIEPLVTLRGVMSMRCINYFVITYAKEYNTCIEQPDGSMVNIYRSYRNWLQTFRRSKFDAFRRGPRITITCGGSDIITTLGQLHYIYWLDTHNILKYLLENKDSIVAHMNNRLKECTTIKKQTKRKRARISKVPESPAVILRVSKSSPQNTTTVQ